jgi:hypothetical protein
LLTNPSVGQIFAYVRPNRIIVTLDNNLLVELWWEVIDIDVSTCTLFVLFQLDIASCVVLEAGGIRSTSFGI